MQALTHEALMDGGRLRTSSPSALFDTITCMTPAAQYVLCGVPAVLAEPTHRALHEWTESLLEGAVSLARAEAFRQVVRTFTKHPPPDRHSVGTVIYVGLARYYGVRFASAPDAMASLQALHGRLRASVDTSNPMQARTQYWSHAGKLLALLGEHATCEPVLPQMQGGFTVEVFKRTLAIMEVARTAPACQIVRVAFHCAAVGFEEGTAAALARVFDGRLDDLCELFARGRLGEETIAQLCGEPRLVRAVSLQALDTLLETWSPDLGSLVETARTLGTDLTQLNAPARASAIGEEEDEDFDGEEDGEDVMDDAPAPTHFDHTRLTITKEQLGAHASDGVLAAVQVYLVWGVLAPEELLSPMLPGSNVRREDFDRRCRPHFSRLGISERDRMTAFQQLTGLRVLLTDKKQRSRIRFDPETHDRMGRLIAQAVLALARQIER